MTYYHCLCRVHLPAACPSQVRHWQPPCLVLSALLLQTAWLLTVLSLHCRVKVNPVHILTRIFKCCTYDKGIWVEHEKTYKAQLWIYLGMTRLRMVHYPICGVTIVYLQEDLAETCLFPWQNVDLKAFQALYRHAELIQSSTDKASFLGYT